MDMEWRGEHRDGEERVRGVRKQNTNAVERKFVEEHFNQDQRNQALKWKAEYDNLFNKYKALQKGGVGEQLGKDFKRFSQTTSEQDLSTIPYDLQTGCHVLTGISFPLPGQGKYTRSDPHSQGSSLPQPSPLLSPGFSSSEESMQQFPSEDDRAEDENKRVAILEEENQCLRGSVQNLKEQNERIRAVVGTMRKEMESLQKTTLEGALKAKSVALSPRKGDIEEMKKIRDEVNLLMAQIVNMTSELQQVQHMKPNLLVQQPLQRQGKLEQQLWQPENAKDVNSRDSVQYDSKEAAARIAELERVQHVLRTQLEKAAHDVMRIANERDLLMEISNSLHADFNRSLQQEKIRQSAPTTQNHHYVGPAQDPSPSSECTFHERRRRVASTSPLCSRASPTRPGRTLLKSLSSSGGQDHSAAAPEHVWINKDGIERGFRRDMENYTYKESKQTNPNEETEHEKEEERRLLLEGRMTPLQERPDLQQDFVHKGTPSQRSKLQASVRRREAQMASRVKVRNYNIKDDETQ